MNSTNRRILQAAGLMAALVALLTFAAGAEASTYGVHECTNAPLGAPDAQAEGTAALYKESSSCGFVGGFLEVRSGGAVGPGLFTQWALQAPGGTQINRVTANVSLVGDSSPDGNAAYLFVRRLGGSDQIDLSVSQGSTSGLYDTALRGIGAIDRIGIGMTCSHSAAQGNCNLRPGMSARMSDIGLNMQDTVPPASPQVGGSALGGWVAGTKQVSFDVSDVGAGVALAGTTVNGIVVDFDGLCSASVDASGSATQMKPCPSARSAATTLELTEAPFEEGANRLEVCGAEYGQNPQITCKREPVYVDNVAPAVAFTNKQDPDDPDKLVAPVGDVTSGVAAGEISYRAEGGAWTPLDTALAGDHLEARVDSANLQPGVRYDFQATAIDRAGNATTTNLRADGSQMSVVGPLRTITDVTQLRVNGKSRSSVSYNNGGVLTGRVVGRDGVGVGAAPVEVSQGYAAGSRRHDQTTTVEARGDGRFRAVLAPGPSRSITARYSGDRRYLGAHSGEVKLAVRAKVTLSVRPRIRAGGAVNFTGKLKARGARLPKAGKRLEVQVKIGPKWKTVGKSKTTDRKGRYRLNYKFIAAYTQPTRFSFRTVAARERSWPYLTAISKQRKVLVIP